MEKKYKNSNKGMRLIETIIYLLIRGIFATGVIIGIIGGYKYDVSLMRLGLTIIIACGVVMGILHIICFRIPNNFIKKFQK